MTTQHARRPTLLSLGLLALLWHCSLESEGQAPNVPPGGMPTEGSGGSDQSGAGQGGTAGSLQGAGGTGGTGGTSGTGGIGGGAGGSDVGGMAGAAGMAGSAGMAGTGGGANCPADKGEFEIAGIGGRCFFMLTSSGGPQRTWDQAKNDCAQLQYALASLPTKAEYEAVRAYLTTDLGVTDEPDSSNSVWISARTEETKVQGSGKFDDLAASYEWLSGDWSFTKASEAPWAMGQPSTESDGDVTEQCVEMRSEAPVFNFLMNNVACNSPHNFALCERPFAQ